ncbi:hypothetical protein ACHHYP_15583 [Achlya hypogyna]|uniref:Uncharacterized protein n=1 Tax=Achlya hypogyna TaxID=1202772 RepID=A0A1V9YAL2_ACHHY|nr:hypothetical protein ACHHYP_15583 [Achlya hypogyna]
MDAADDLEAELARQLQEVSAGDDEDDEDVEAYVHRSLDAVLAATRTTLDDTPPAWTAFAEATKACDAALFEAVACGLASLESLQVAAAPGLSKDLLVDLPAGPESPMLVLGVLAVEPHDDESDPSYCSAHCAPTCESACAEHCAATNCAYFRASLAAQNVRAATRDAEDQALLSLALQSVQAIADAARVATASPLRPPEPASTCPVPAEPPPAELDPAAEAAAEARRRQQEARRRDEEQRTALANALAERDRCLAEEAQRLEAEHALLVEDRRSRAAAAHARQQAERIAQDTEQAQMQANDAASAAWSRELTVRARWAWEVGRSAAEEYELQRQETGQRALEAQAAAARQLEADRRRHEALRIERLAEEARRETALRARLEEQARERERAADAARQRAQAEDEARRRQQQQAEDERRLQREAEERRQRTVFERIEAERRQAIQAEQRRAQNEVQRMAAADGEAHAREAADEVARRAAEAAARQQRELMAATQLKSLVLRTLVAQLQVREQEARARLLAQQLMALEDRRSRLVQRARYAELAAQVSARVQSRSFSAWVRAFQVRGRRAHAAVCIQRRWRQRRQHDAAARVQSAFRGFHVRRKIASALALAKFVDDDDFEYEAVDVDDFLGPVDVLDLDDEPPPRNWEPETPPVDAPDCGPEDDGREASEEEADLPTPAPAAEAEASAVSKLYQRMQRAIKAKPRVDRGKKALPKKTPAASSNHDVSQSVTWSTSGKKAKKVNVPSLVERLRRATAATR